MGSGMKFKKLDDKDLLESYADLMEELRRRGLIRSNNNPTSDYAEKIAADKLKLELCDKSTKGYDAIHKKTGLKYQIKGRRITRHNKSRQLGVIRNLDEKLFNFLIVIIFDEIFKVKEAYEVPYDVVLKLAKERGKWSKQQHGYIIHANNELIQFSRVINITSKKE